MPFGKEYATHSTMGRFGNVLLTNGDTNYSLSANEGEVIRFYITNAANVRPFKLSFGGARMKLVGTDMGKYEREELGKMTKHSEYLKRNEGKGNLP